MSISYKILFSIFIFIIFFSFKSQVFAQESNVRDFFSVYDDTSDTRLQLLHHTDAKHYMIHNKLFVFEYKNDLNRFLDTTGIDAPNTWRGDEIDFDKNSLVLFGYHGVDCHSKFRFGFNDNEELKTYFIRVTILYGGCRAGGRFYERWALIPKLPSGYNVKISTRVIDDIHHQYEEFKEE